MSLFLPVEVECPCGRRFQVEACDSLHVTRRPELRQAILDGSFHAFPCPRCARRVILEKLFAYTDFDRRHWFTVFPGDDLARWRGLAARAESSFRDVMEVSCPPLVRAWAPGFLRRAVFGLGALRERLVVLDAGLDDRRVELAKLELVREHGLALTPSTVLRFDALASGALVFRYCEPRLPGPQGASTWRRIEVARPRYEALGGREPEWRASLPELVDGSVVDFHIAVVPGGPAPSDAARGGT
jgi:hypothetical protein